ncbi:hypothetical protein Esti_000343 [Eimeria stiedai]
MAAPRSRLSTDDKPFVMLNAKKSFGKVSVGPILNAGKLKALLLADGNSTRKCKALDLSHSNIRKVELSLGEVSALDFEGLSDLDLHGNLMVALDGHSLAFPHLQNLRASNCRIRSLTNFGSHFKIRQLDLSCNHLTDLTGLADTPLRFTLQALNLANNHIREFKGLAPLSTFESLESLDMRGNPLTEFGLVAEGFALLSCPTLRQLNGRRVSEEVREAVDSWAFKDGCGRATAATVEAFRDALLHPQGLSLLATAAQTPRQGRLPRPTKSDDVTSLSSDWRDHSSGVVGEQQPDAEDIERANAKKQPPCENHQEACLIPCNLSGKGHFVFETRMPLADAQAATEEPTRAHSAASGSLARDLPGAGGASHGRAGRCFSYHSGDFHPKDYTDVRDERISACRQNDVSVGSNAASAPLEREVLVHSSPAPTEIDACEPCKSCLCGSIPHMQYYHCRMLHTSVAGDLSPKKMASGRRSCAVRGCCCTGTQTPAGWIHPLEMTEGSRSASKSRDFDNDEEGQSGLCRVLCQPPADGEPSEPDGEQGKEISVSIEETQATLDEPALGEALAHDASSPTGEATETSDAFEDMEASTSLQYFVGVIGLGVSVRGAIGTFVARRQLRYGFRPGEALQHDSSAAYFDRQASFPSQHAVLSPELFAEGDVSIHGDRVALWPPSEASGPSLLQLQSEAEEEDTSEATDSEEKETSTTEAHGDHISTLSEAAENPNDRQKHDDADSKEVHNHVSSNETQKANKEPAGGEADEEEEKAHSNHETETKTSSSSEKETLKHAQEKKGTDGGHQGNSEEAQSSEAEGNLEPHFDAILSRLRALLKASAGKKLFAKLTTMIDLHEKEEEAEKALKKEAEKLEMQEEKLSHVVVPDSDLLLSQQLNNMWVLPLHDDEKRQTCLSGFEKLTHEATITCSDPECFKLETNAKTCPYMSIVSIMRKEDLNSDEASAGKVAKTEATSHRDHMLLGFDGECRHPESLGKEVLSILQRPKNMAMKHALERTTGTSSAVPLQKHHLDLVCDPDDRTEYPSCKTVFEALNHFAEPHPRALPELLVLTDIGDLKNTLGLYRLTFIFEGLVQFAAPEGTKLDASKHKLKTEDAEFIRKHRHQDITSTVLLKDN